MSGEMMIAAIAAVILAVYLAPLRAARLRDRRLRHHQRGRRERDRRGAAATQAHALAYWQQMTAREQSAARGQIRHYAYIESSMYDIDQMDGVDFEHYVAARLRNTGYTVQMTNTTGDFGVNRIATARTGKQSPSSASASASRWGRQRSSRSLPVRACTSATRHGWSPTRDSPRRRLNSPQRIRAA
jgi:hypothetical protein